jgi:hypothetical protein
MKCNDPCLEEIQWTPQLFFQLAGFSRTTRDISNQPICHLFDVGLLLGPFKVETRTCYDQPLRNFEGRK